MKQWIAYFKEVLATTFALYFGQESRHINAASVPRPEGELLLKEVGEPLNSDEQLILLLALMPHLSPKDLDLFFIQNKALDRQYTEFGGWKGQGHTGFLPTGATASFLLEGGDEIPNERLFGIFGKNHVFAQHNILRLEGQLPGEPFLSGRLVVSQEFLEKVIPAGVYDADYQSDFPAKRMSTELHWDDLVVSNSLKSGLDDIASWLQHEGKIRSQWSLSAIIKPGYRCLFHGPPGTGKTLAATLLGKRHNMEVYRIDLSMVVSKYIGETEKNLGQVFDRASHQRWVLFFDEADALFSKRTETSSSNDRYANQEVAYLLQRIEDFAGVVVLATNLKDNLDEAFLRRFQQVLHFSMPDERQRKQLWQKWVPTAWLERDDDILQVAASYNLSGGTIVNVIQQCAIRLFNSEYPRLTVAVLKEAIRREQEKHGVIVDF